LALAVLVLAMVMARQAVTLGFHLLFQQVAADQFSQRVGLLGRVVQVVALEQITVLLELQAREHLGKVLLVVAQLLEVLAAVVVQVPLDLLE
jgi:hypothetical protein